MKAFGHVELVGEKVKLRPARVEDAAAVYDLFRDDRVVRWLFVEAPASLEEEEAWFKHSSALPRIESNGQFSYYLAIERLGAPGQIGGVSLHQRGHVQQ